MQLHIAIVNSCLVYEQYLIYFSLICYYGFWLTLGIQSILPPFKKNQHTINGVVDNFSVGVENIFPHRKHSDLVEIVLPWLKICHQRSKLF